MSFDADRLYALLPAIHRIRDVERRAQVARNRGAKVEIDRRCYLDARLAKPGPGFDRVAANVVGRWPEIAVQR